MSCHLDAPAGLQIALGILLLLAISIFSAVSFMIQCKRKTFWAKSKTFKVPLVPLIPLIGMVITIHIILGVGMIALSVYTFWISLGLVIYFSYGICLSYNARTGRDSSTIDADSGIDTDSLLDEREDL